MTRFPTAAAASAASAVAGTVRRALHDRGGRSGAVGGGAPVAATRRTATLGGDDLGMVDGETEVRPRV